MPEIVKVQVPLFGGSVSQCMVYDKGRKHVSIRSLPLHVHRGLADDPKGYFMAEWKGRSGWLIAERVADQPW